MSASTATWAIRYIEKYGLALVQIPRGHKAPLHQGWNQPGGYVTDAEEARQRWNQHPEHGIGVVLGPSGLCSIDVDSPEHALPALAELGVDLGALRKATPTIRGNPDRYRLMFRPPGVALGRKTLVWPAKEPGGNPLTLFELRAGDIQDVLPPTVHPGTGKPYIWLVPPNSEFPILPESLLELWQHWDSYRKELEAVCPWATQGFRPEPAPRGPGARPDVIAAFNRARPVEELLSEHGYQCRGQRWISPTSSSGLAGVVVLDGRVFSHHASDPLADDHTHDAFDLFRILDHGGDARAAVKAAAEELGMGPATLSAKAPDGDGPRPGNGAAPSTGGAGSDGEKARLDAVEIWVQSDSDKPSRLRPQTDILIDIGRQVPQALFLGDDDRAYAVVRDRSEVWPIASKRFREWLRGCYFARVGKGANANSVRDAIDTIEAAARNSGDERAVFLRVAEAEGKLYVDLCDRDWRVVEIDAEGWRILDRSPVMFTRRGSFTPFPVPESGGSLNELWPFINAPVEARPLVACWLAAALYPRGPYPPLVLQGEHGSAKSSTALMARLLCDPSDAPLRSVPKDEDGFKALCAGAWCICIDNLSGIQPWLSDLLCRAASGITLGGRKLYSDLDEELIKVSRPIILNGIEALAIRGDLADRAITVGLGPISDERRLTDDELRERFEGARPRLFGVLLSALSQAVRELPNVPKQPLPRMADFAKLGVACETALGFKAGEFMAAYRSNIKGSVETVLESAVAQGLSKFITSRVEWAGTATELLDTIGPKDDDHRRSASEWPRSGRGMTGALTRLAPALRRVGIHVEYLERVAGKGTRLLRLTLRVPAQPSQPSQPSQPAWNAGPSRDGSKLCDDLTVTPTVTPTVTAEPCDDLTVTESGNRHRPSQKNHSENNIRDERDGCDGLAGPLHTPDDPLPGDGDPLLHRVVISIAHGTRTHRSFEASDPAGQTLAVWQAKVLAAHGPDATVRSAPVEQEVLTP